MEKPRLASVNGYMSCGDLLTSGVQRRRSVSLSTSRSQSADDLTSRARVENRFNRAYYVERVRSARGMLPKHPLLNQDIRKNNSNDFLDNNELPSQHRTWEKYFNYFLDTLMPEITTAVKNGSNHGSDAAEAIRTAAAASSGAEGIDMKSLFETLADKKVTEIPTSKVSEKASRRKNLFGDVDWSSAEMVEGAIVSSAPAPATVQPEERKQSDGPNAFLRHSLTAFKNAPQINGNKNVTASPFLGDDSSVYKQNFFGGRVPKISSMSELHRMISNKSLLQPFPLSKDTNDLLSSVQQNAWQLPYILALTLQLRRITPTSIVNILYNSASYFDVGVVFVNLHPLWSEWLERRMFGWDNFIFETLNVADAAPLGFMCLNSSIVTLMNDTRPAPEGTTPKMVEVQYFADCAAASRTAIYLHAHDKTLELFERLKRMAEMSMQDIYTIIEDEDSPPELGRGNISHFPSNHRNHICVLGRYTEVRRAMHRNAIVRPQVPNDSPLFPEPSGPTSLHDAGFCAVKIINKAKFYELAKKGRERNDTMIREVVSQALVSHNISGVDAPVVKIFGVFETKDSFIIELELMQSIDCYDFLCDNCPLDEGNAKIITRQLLKAMQCCSQFNIVHRDIKLTNITFAHTLRSYEKAYGTSKHSEKKNLKYIRDNLVDIIKLADFGMSGFVDSLGKVKGRCGTPGYVAPEILKAGVNEGYHSNVDIFSVSMIFYCICITDNV